MTKLEVAVFDETKGFYALLNLRSCQHEFLLNKECLIWNMLIQHDISLSERMSEKGLVSLHVVCVCCAFGAAFTGAYGGFAC